MFADLSMRLLVLLLLMAGLALLESWVPFKVQQRSWRSRAPNLWLAALFFAMNLVLTVGSVALAARFGGTGFSLVLPPWAAFVAGVLLLDLSAYVVHVLMHRVPALWRVHRVHHSDEAVDVTTAYRQHPLETLLRFAFTLVPAMLLGIGPEAVAVYRLLSGVNALFEHANIRLPGSLERPLRWLVVTPAMHKVHHSCVPAETDSNYGNIVPWFDRLFRTYVAPRRDLTYGLGWRGDLHRSLGGLLRLPWSGRDPLDSTGSTIATPSLASEVDAP